MNILKKPYVQFSFSNPNSEKQTMDIKADIGFYFANIPESNGTFTYYIPCFDICYSVSSKEDGRLIANSAVSAFIQFWIREKGIDLFIRHLRTIGFNPEGDIWVNVLSNKSFNRKFKGGNIVSPKSFQNVEMHFSEMALAS